MSTPSIVKTLANSRSGSLAREFPPTLSRPAWAILLLISAALVGWGIAGERWMILGAILAGGLVLLWPVQVTLGAFAFLAPFDTITAMSDEGLGTTLTWY
ncbi:MAG TPA: hypothetical protein VH744_08315, partial [Terriglobales bacterium]